MTGKRYLCSDLLRIRGTRGFRAWLNLEEIWPAGAVLEAEMPVLKGQKLLLSKNGGRIWGEVTACLAHEFGYRVELRFLPGAVWSPELFLPAHSLEIGEAPAPAS